MKSLFFALSVLFTLITDVFASTVNSSIDGLFSFKRVGFVAVSPDTKHIAYTSFQIKDGPSGKKWQYSLYLKTGQVEPKLLVNADMIVLPGWSPSGKYLTYLAKGKKFQSIWIVSGQDHKPKKLIELNRDISSYKWSPNESYIVFSAADDEVKPKALIPYDPDKDYINTRLYLISIRNNYADQATLQPITPSNWHIPQFYESPEFDWSADNQSLVFTYQPKIGALYAQQSKIGRVDLKTKHIETLAYTQINTGTQPWYSPDGKWIAFRSRLEPTKTATKLNNDVNLQARICVFNTTSQKTHCLSNTFNENPVILGWDQASKNVLVIDNYKAIGYQIYALNLDLTVPAKMISNVTGFIQPLTISLNHSSTMLGFGYETTSQAPQIFTATINPFILQQISNFHNDMKKTLGKTETIQWSSPDGLQIEGLLTLPANYSANKKYPLYVDVHGGPAGAWAKRYLGGCEEYGNMFIPTSCWGHLAELGFIILAPNPRGSSGYGHQFQLANFKDLGGHDFQDIMSGVDYLIKKNIVDTNKMVIAGWSFGGYMASWAISQTNRFRLAIEGDGNTNMISFTGTTDIPEYYTAYLGDYFWNNNALYAQRSPLSYVKNIVTPLLIITGEHDVRVPATQAYELYNALRLQNKPVKMLVLPEQGHVPNDANIIYESIKAIDEWLKQIL